MVYIKNYIEKTNEIWESAILLWNSLISFSAPAFLTHWSIELYLKAFLLDKNKKIKEITKGRNGHDLIKLYNQAKEIDINIYKENIKREINLINKFGYPYGGIRYLDKSKSSYYMLRPNTCAILEDLIS